MSFAGPLLLAALFLQADPPAECCARDTGEIRGQVTAQRERRTVPLGYALVEVRGPAGPLTVLADAAGRYVVTGVPAGVPLRVRAIHLGHEEARLEVLVPAGSRISVDLVLRPRPVELPGLVVRAGTLTAPPLPDVDLPQRRERTRAEVTLRALEASPGLVEAGLGDAAAARRPPGNEPADPTDVLFMRGSTADLKLVLLDGAPVYTPFHLGGLLRSFEAELLGSATHYAGGAPARYDGGLSYILDLRTRSPNRDSARWSGGLDLMSARTTVETPLLGDRAGVLFSSRALHGLQSRLAGGRASPYGYLDGLVRGELDLAAGHRLSLLAFGNDESVRLGLAPAEAEVVADASPRAALAPLRPGSASWGNGALALSYAGEWERTGLDVGASTSRYRASLPLPLPEAAAPGEPAGAENDAEPPGALLTQAETERTRLTVDVVRFRQAGALRYGFSVDRLRIRADARSLAHPASEAIHLDYEKSGAGTVVGAYLDVLHRLAPELHLRSGVRVDRYAPGGVRGALRGALLWNLTEDALLTLAAGRYHQLVRAGDAETELAMGFGVTAGTANPLVAIGAFPLLSVASADHLVLSLDQQLAPGLRLNTEGFFKRFDRLSGVSRGDLNASGLDLRVLRESERLTGWLGYSLSWFWDSPDALGRSQEFTGRHLLSVGLQGRAFGRWGGDLALAYGDGLPLTSVPFPRATASFESAQPTLLSADAVADGPAPLRTSDSFLRLDVEVSLNLQPTWGGRNARLRPYLRVLNALDRRDALFYYFEPWRDPGLRPLAELSVIPVLGLEWRF